MMGVMITIVQDPGRSRAAACSLQVDTSQQRAGGKRLSPLISLLEFLMQKFLLGLRLIIHFCIYFTLQR